MKLLETIVEKHMKIINWVGVILASWILSMIVAELIGSFLPEQQLSAAVSSDDNALSAITSIDTTKGIEHYMPICQRNIFDSEKRSACEKKAVASKAPTTRTEPRIDPDAAPVKSSINAKLKGTTVFGDPKRSFATISVDGKSETENFKVDDEIVDRAKIYKIERNIVYLTNKGRKEYLEIQDTKVSDNKKPASKPPAPGGGVKQNGNTFTISRSKVEKTLANMNKVIQDARMVPNYQNGVVNGFKVFAIKSGSIFQELGLRNGDQINQVNGAVVDSIEKALPMLQLLKTESNFEIGITRRGQKQALKIVVE